MGLKKKKKVLNKNGQYEEVTTENWSLQQTGPEPVMAQFTKKSYALTWRIANHNSSSEQQTRGQAVEMGKHDREMSSLKGKVNIPQVT